MTQVGTEAKSHSELDVSTSRTCVLCSFIPDHVLRPKVEYVFGVFYEILANCGEVIEMIQLCQDGISII